MLDDAGMGKLTTHVLDTVAGGPAEGVRVRLYRDGELLEETLTNVDGRCDGPLLEGRDLVTERYELVFSVREYFEGKGVACPFLDEVGVKFRMEAGGSYHVPLVCSPWAYSTYRGS